MNKIKIAACAALGMISLAVSSYAQFVTANDGDLFLGFRTANSPGNALNLEVDLGSYTNFTLMNGGSFFLPQLSVLDLQSTYGSGTSWQRSDLFWSISASDYNSNPPGLPNNTLFETSVSNGNPSTVFQRQTSTVQHGVSQQIDFAISGLNGAPVTPNSNFASLVMDSQVNSYDNAISNGNQYPQPWNATTFSLMTFANVENNTAIPGGGFVSSDLYELLPTTSGRAPSVLLGTFELFGNGQLEFFSVIPEPSTYRMLALGAALLCGLMILRRRRSVRS